MPRPFLLLDSGGRAAGPVRLGIDRGFRRRGNILAAGAFENVLGPVYFLRRSAVHREKNSTLLYAAFIALGFIFGNAEADARPGNSSHGAADAHACQRG